MTDIPIWQKEDVGEWTTDIVFPSRGSGQMVGRLLRNREGGSRFRPNKDFRKDISYNVTTIYDLTVVSRHPTLEPRGRSVFGIQQCRETSPNSLRCLPHLTICHVSIA